MMVKLEQLAVAEFDNSQSYTKEVNIQRSKIEELVQLTMDDKLLWCKHRSCRITGTTCYSLFTYRLQDWEKKVATTLLSTFRGNAQTLYGNEMESAARDRYAICSVDL